MGRHKMTVPIQIHPFLRQFVGGQKIVEVEGKTVGECLADLETKFPAIKQHLYDKEGRLAELWDVYVNSESYYSEGLAKPVKEGDQFVIVALMHGG
jgi:molybdopterin converting factor small subunit